MPSTEHKSKTRLYLLLLLIALVSVTTRLSGQGEWKARDAWQRPEEVMNALEIKAGSMVADVGAGGGYFTFHLAARVGPTGKVYAEDILEDEVNKIRARAAEEGLAQIKTIHGSKGDPQLPAESLNAILVVNSYHEMREYDSMLRAMLRGLKPGGLLGVIDAPAEPGEPREKYFDRHRIPERLLREDAARNGFTFVRKEPGFNPPDGNRNYFFLIFRRPDTKDSK